MMLRRAQIFVLLFLVIGVLLVFQVSPSILESYVSSAPRAANQSTGQIHAFNQHGTIVYLSLKEIAATHLVTGAGMLSLIACAFCMKKWFSGKVDKGS